MLESLLRLYSGWSSAEDGFKAIFFQSGVASTVAYDKEATREVRFEALVGTFTTVVELTNSVWWHNVLLKAFMVQFYAGFQREFKLRQAEYSHLK